MCGIVGYIGEYNAVDVLLDGLYKLEYRGYDSSGVALMQEGEILTVKSKGRLKDLEDKIKSLNLPQSHCGIGHTRWATHGQPSDVNSHPHGSSKITLVHNGIIENYLEIKDMLLKQGVTFETETDTEVIAKLFEVYYDGKPLSTIKKVLEDIKGSYALGILFADFPNEIYALRKDSPLIAAIGQNGNFIASDVPAILKYTNKYFLINEGEIVRLKKDGITVWDKKHNEIEKEILTADWDIKAAEKDGYPHFMLKEIYEQPDAFVKTVRPRIKNDLPDLQVESLTDQKLKSINKIHIVACGTASHAGIIGQFALEKLAKTDVQVQIASEFRYNDPILHKNDIVVLISQSGETADTLAALRLAKSKGIYTLAVVNAVGSSIAREADGVIYTWAGPEIAVASTKAYTVQMAVMYLFAIKLALAKGEIDEPGAQKLCRTLMELPQKQQQVLDNADSFNKLAYEIQNSQHLFFIGRGIDYALSMEGSLKLKEISYIHSEAYAAGELKHGTISLITDNVPVIAIATQPSVYKKTISNIKETAARGAKTVLIVREDLPVSEGVADFVLTVPKTEDIFSPLSTIIALQLTAYYTALQRGCDIDKPRNLAKSVTVE